MSAIPRSLIFILAAIIALGPLSIDLYLPAMPSMRLYFATDISAVQLTLSSYLLGFSLFHLVCGPLSDRYGRKSVLIAGLSLYVVMSALCAMAQTIEQLIVFRFFQAMGACCAPTLGRAIVRDVYPPQDAVRALAYVSSIMAVAPVIAPSLGGFLIEFTDWRFLFWLLVGFGLIAIGLTVFLVPESLPEKQSIHPAVIASNFITLLRHPVYSGSVLTASFLYSGIFAFLSGISFVLIEFLGVKANHFGLYFLFIVSGYIAGSLFTARVAYRWPPQKLFVYGILIALIASVALTLVTWLQYKSALLIMLPITLTTFSIGLVMPQATALALIPFPHMAATASALMGFLQMALAGIAGWFVGHFLVDDPLPMALVLLATVLLSMVCYWFLLPKGIFAQDK